MFWREALFAVDHKTQIAGTPVDEAWTIRGWTLFVVLELLVEYPLGKFVPETDHKHVHGDWILMLDGAWTIFADTSWQVLLVEATLDVFVLAGSTDVVMVAGEDLSGIFAHYFRAD